MFGRKKKDEDEMEIDEKSINDVFDDDEFRLEKPKRWYHYVFMQKEVLVFYLVCTGLLVITVTPLVLHSRGYFPDTDGAEVFGICGVLDDFRVDCAPDTDISVEDCEKRNCCFDSETPNSTVCYHSLPSKMSARYTSQVNSSAGSVKTFGYNEDEEKEAYYLLSSVENHLMFELGESISGGLGSDLNLKVNLSCPENDDCKGKVLTLDVRYGDSGNSQASLVRTHFGPIIYSENASEISFYLPNSYVYASGLQNMMMGEVQEQTIFNLGLDTQVHLPVVFGLYDIERWYLIYLETNQPGLQTLHPGSGDQPLLTWTFLGDNIKVHILIADSPLELQKKLKTSLGVDPPSNHSPTSPEGILMKYGYHLCRKTQDPSRFSSDRVNMTAEKIAYDTDCVNELLMPTSFMIDESFIVDAHDDDDDPRLVLPVTVQVDHSHTDPPPCVKLNNDTKCVVGSYNNLNVTFPDVFQTEYQDWFEAQYSNLNQNFPNLIESVYIHDASPVDESNTQQKQDLSFLPRDISLYNQLDMLSYVQRNGKKEKYKNVMAEYPKKLMQILTNKSMQLKEVRSDVAVLGMPTSVTFTGSKFEATWENMRRSLREALILSSLGLPYYSMSACGTKTTNSTDGYLCLRWFQMAALMPGIHSWYSGDDLDRMPYMLEKTFLRYIRWALEDRYRMLPYYKTLDKEWHDNSMPIIRPMFFMHPQPKYLHIWTQFYLGDRILVAPVLDEETNIVEIKFPPGSWYRLGSGIPVDLPFQGATVKVTSKLYEIPAFLKGGSVLVYHEIEENITLRETEKRPYMAMISLECAHGPRQNQRIELSSCISSGSIYLGSNYTLQTQVSTNKTEGLVSFTFDMKITKPLNKLNSLEVLGLQPGGQKLTVTLPDGSSYSNEEEENITTTSVDDSTTTSVDDSTTTSVGDSTTTSMDDSTTSVSYNADKQYLVIKNMNIILTESCSLHWRFT